MVYVKNLSALKRRKMEKPVDPIADYLRSWGLEMYIERFAEHAIDAETLQMLSDGDVKDLIPVIGHRAKFMAQLNLLKSMTDPNPDAPSTSASSSSDPSPGSFNIEDLPVLTDSTLLLLPEAVEETSHTCDLYKLLSSCNEGKGLLLRFQESGLLNSAARRKLCSIIISNELKDNPEKKITSSRFYQLAYEINNIFKKESAAIYFTPFTQFNPRQKITAKGKLLDCYRCTRRNFLKSGVIVGRNKRCSSALSSNSEAELPGRLVNSRQEAVDLLQSNTDDIEDKLLWLKNCVDPWATVELYWNKTSKERLKLLTGSTITIDKYLEEFKALNQPAGLYLLLSDFKHLYPETDEKLKANWYFVKTKIVEYVKKKIDGIAQEIIECINGNDEETTDIGAFMALPFLMNTHTIVKPKKGKRQQFRPSKKEVLDSFITHVHTAAEIEENITRRREKLQKLELHLQPFVMVVGPSLKEISARYVVLNNIRYEVTSLVNAVDACFKIIFVLNAEYPMECKHVWQFIQKSMFKLVTKYEKNYTTVDVLITDLNIAE